MQENNKHNILVGIISVIFGCLLILVSSYVRLQANEVQIYPDFTEYRFEIDFYPSNVTLNDFLLYYDFGSMQGNISFKFRGNQDHTVLYLPPSLEYSDSILINNKNTMPFSPEYVRDDIYYKVMPFAFNNSVEDLTLIVNFKGIIYPYGRYSLNVGTNRVYSDGANSMQFLLGDYTCQENCFSLPYYTSLYQEGKLLKFAYTEEYETQRANPNGQQLYQSFTLNTIDEKAIDKKSLFSNISVSLFIAGIVMLMEAIICFFVIFIKKGIIQGFFRKVNKASINLIHRMKSHKIPTAGSWIKILIEIYKYAPRLYIESFKLTSHDDTPALAKKLHISHSDVILGITFLKNMDLIKKQTNGKGDNSFSTLILTEKGFNVVMDILKHKDSARLQAIIAVFAAFTVIIQLVNYSVSQSLLLPRTGLLLTVVTILIIYFVIRHKLKD